jgi:hypothetical protein
LTNTKGRKLIFKFIGKMTSMLLLILVFRFLPHLYANY